MEKQNSNQLSANILNEFDLEKIITTSIQIPGVKVDRKKFLAETFSSYSDQLQDIWEVGPIDAGISREDLNKLAHKLILTRTSQSSAASFAAGLPGGLAMAATVPADVLQFFGMSLRLAQELSYLYGGEDLWKEGKVDNENVRNQLVLYSGVMFGVSGAAAGVRVLSKQIAKTALKKIPQKALTKTFWYPIIKQIGKAIGVKVTKSAVAKSVSNFIPVVGGVISGGLNFASMMPMANRLHSTLDEACFGYTQEQLDADVIALEHIDENDETSESNSVEDIKEKVSNSVKAAGDGLKSAGAAFSGFINKHKKGKEETVASTQESDDEIFSKIEKLATLNEKGILSNEEFEAKKAELLEKL